MFELKRLNVHRIVDSEAKRDRLIAKGFELVKKAEEVKPVHACPHCGKEYKKPGDLDKHIAKEHPDGGTPPAPDNGGSGQSGGQGEE